MANLAEKLAQSVSSWGTKLTYGEKTVVGGHELVPVALVGFGFGAGEGASQMPDGGNSPVSRGEGNGGGGGGYAVPIGAYIGGSDGLKFQPNLIALVVVAVPFVSAVGVALAQIIRALRTRSAN